MRCFESYYKRHCETEPDTAARTAFTKAFMGAYPRVASIKSGGTALLRAFMEAAPAVIKDARAAKSVMTSSVAPWSPHNHTLSDFGSDITDYASGIVSLRWEMKERGLFKRCTWQLVDEDNIVHARLKIWSSSKVMLDIECNQDESHVPFEAFEYMVIVSAGIILL